MGRMVTEKHCEDALIISVKKLKGKKQDGRQLNSLSSSRMLQRMQSPCFKAEEKGHTISTLQVVSLKVTTIFLT